MTKAKTLEIILLSYRSWEGLLCRKGKLSDVIILQRPAQEIWFGLTLSVIYKVDGSGRN